MEQMELDTIRPCGNRLPRGLHRVRKLLPRKSDNDMRNNMNPH